MSEWQPVLLWRWKGFDGLALRLPATRYRDRIETQRYVPATAYDHLRKGLEAEVEHHRKQEASNDSEGFDTSLGAATKAWARARVHDHAADRLEALLAEEEK